MKFLSKATSQRKKVTLKRSKSKEHTIREYSRRSTLIKPINLFLPQQKDTSQNNSSNLKIKPSKHRQQLIYLSNTMIFQNISLLVKGLMKEDSFWIPFLGVIGCMQGQVCFPMTRQTPVEKQADQKTIERHIYKANSTRQISNLPLWNIKVFSQLFNVFNKIPCCVIHQASMWSALTCTSLEEDNVSQENQRFLVNYFGSQQNGKCY